MSTEDRLARYRASNSRGLGKELLDPILELAGDLKTSDFFRRHSGVAFWYERQHHDTDDDLVTDRIGAAAKAWAADQNNIDRAAEAVMRPTKPAHEDLVLAFVIARFKALQEWTLATPKCEQNVSPQTLICVAMEDINVQNGLFMQLDKGCDICIDCEVPLPKPPGGTGLALLIWLNI